MGRGRRAGERGRPQADTTWGFSRASVAPTPIARNCVARRLGVGADGTWACRLCRRVSRPSPAFPDDAGRDKEAAVGVASLTFDDALAREGLGPLRRAEPRTLQ